MGVNCENGVANVVLLADGEPDPDCPTRISYPDGREELEALEAVIDETGRVLTETKPDKVVILWAAGQYTATHRQLTPRIAMETSIRLACARKEVPVEMIARETVKSKLGLPKKGALDSHLAKIFPEPHGPYWKQGRGLAALAAASSEDPDAAKR